MTSLNDTGNDACAADGLAGGTPAAPRRGGDRPPVEVLRPQAQTAPIVLSSPHSGDVYPAEFTAATALDPLALRTSEDAFVDDLFAGGIALGMPMVRATFPRAYLDVNREAYELDPAMFADPLPPHVNTRSARVAGGLGTIARRVGGGRTIYRRKLSFAEAEARIARCYRPYHAALSALLAETRDTFGAAVLIDCHSMPSVGGFSDLDAGEARPDVILGDRHGTACAPDLIDRAEEAFRSLGLSVARNRPYAGGFNTQHYGRPGERVHAFQIEVRRDLYMDETRIEPTAGYAPLKAQLCRFLELMTDALARP
ncbi:MAG: N-formylglutamate amidohydrolase [Alphaproteobacteria bacterium]|nr:N-formylglutamate amidohydrolase [Alphaproteobacteria bacterium]MDX5367739.1 N-formylglutamate amidohydrolase [Alphaproteobacteria bacterium]MDX5462622.1 N-formylglutamate amidohydrolase [Alphaproteobacteria bacterium]